ncbi:MotA/TolQ/ExbB proton channel family protein [Cellvibrio sp. NN19]|uniref:MotA/TolQ/ExbB proton channel family protein n=1 Tax=Cellvibrio chitinivorans TaxID=3102792 RepID=UPI002B415B5B|nr:MotA/TolQ/ExbB proton channel family protein [Cellvibrio sp. NN19]
MKELYTFAVELTLWLLVAFSIITWTLIIIKGVQNFLVARRNHRFTQAFWGASDLNAAAGLENHQGSAAQVAQVGFRTLRSADSSYGNDLEHSWDRQDLLERHLRQQIQKERRSLESGLAVLASIGTTAPFIGLFGTVFGIIEALTAISSSSSASIEVVAGPIGHALIATGFGIAVAIPSVLAYNYFLRRLKLIAADLDDFATDFVTLVQKARFRIKPTAITTKLPTHNLDTDSATDKSSEVFA